MEICAIAVEFAFLFEFFRFSLFIQYFIIFIIYISLFIFLLYFSRVASVADAKSNRNAFAGAPRPALRWKRERIVGGR